MASKYWVGGGSNTNWNANPVTNWANSDGGAGNQTAPAAGDAVFFTANSGTGGVGLNVAISLTGFNCTGSRNAFTGTSAFTLTAGDLILPDGVGATWGHTGGFTLTATSGTQHINCNGKQFGGGVTLNGAGGTFQLTGDFSSLNGGTVSVLSLTAGTFDCQTYTVTYGTFTCSGSTTRAIQGSGLWTCNNTTTSGTTVMNIGTGTNLTVSSWSSNHVFTLNGTNGKTIAFGGYTIQGTVTINLQTAGSLQFGLGAASTFSSLVTLNGGAGLSLVMGALNNTFNGGLTIVGPFSCTWAGNQTIAGFNVSGGPVSFSFAVANTQTLSGTVSFVGTAAAPIGFQGGTYNSTKVPISMASGTPTFTWCSFRDMAFSGGATFAATNSFDLGNNSGITITGPQLGIQPSYSVGI